MASTRRILENTAGNVGESTEVREHELRPLRNRVTLR